MSFCLPYSVLTLGITNINHLVYQMLTFLFAHAESVGGRPPKSHYYLFCLSLSTSQPLNKWCYFYFGISEICRDYLHFPPIRYQWIFSWPEIWNMAYYGSVVHKLQLYWLLHFKLSINLNFIVVFINLSWHQGLVF